MVKVNMSAAFCFYFSCFKIDVFSLTFLITFLVRDFHLLLEDLLQLLGFFLLGVFFKGSPSLGETSLLLHLGSLLDLRKEGLLS